MTRDSLGVHTKGRSLRSGDTKKRSKRSSNDASDSGRACMRENGNNSSNHVARSQKKKSNDNSRSGRRSAGLLTMPTSNIQENIDVGSNDEDNVLSDVGYDTRKRKHNSSKDNGSDEDSSSSEEEDAEDKEDSENVSEEEEKENEMIPDIAATDGRGARKRVVGTYVRDTCVMSCVLCLLIVSMY